MEACATAHYWARELARLGHTVRLVPASYVKAYVKRSKTHAAGHLRGGDAAKHALCARQDGAASAVLIRAHFQLSIWGDFSLLSFIRLRLTDEGDEGRLLGMRLPPSEAA